MCEGDWLIADRQTEGRGRIGRAWQSPHGNLYASTAVTLAPSDPSAPTLALVAAVALHDALCAAAPRVSPQIKWPNDVLVDGAKIAGILLDRVDQSVVVGIGVNLAHHPEGLDRPVTSLAALGQAPTSPRALLDELASQWDQALGHWRLAGLAQLRTAWLARAHPIGTPLSATLPDGRVLEGTFDGLDDDCALRLRPAASSDADLADLGHHVIHAADVFLI